jgi:hypothetical protein
MPSEQELIATVRDESLNVTERRAALKHLARLRGESLEGVGEIPESNLKQFLAAMTVWSSLGLKNMTLASAASAVAEGEARRIANKARKA